MTTDSLPPPAEHLPWCERTGCDGHGCYSRAWQTPVGEMWIQASGRGPLIITDPATVAPVMTITDLSVLGLAVAEIRELIGRST